MMENTTSAIVRRTEHEQTKRSYSNAFEAVSRIQKIYYEWQNHKTRKIYNDTIRMLSKRIQKMNEKGDKILIYIGDELPNHDHPEDKRKPMEHIDRIFDVEAKHAEKRAR